MTLATMRTQQPAASPELERLRARLVGELLTPGDEAYETARRIHDITVDRYPLAIVRATGAGDVAAALDFAREQGHPFTVRSGGHSVGYHSVANGALMIDLSDMRGVSIDDEARIARVQAGATSADLVTAAHAYGLTVSTGDTASVGLGGLITGGGIGYLVRRYGLTVDSLLSVEIVTADGEVRIASEREHPDLFWAVRGGGGNFGVITEFELRLAPVGEVVGGALVLPATREVIRGYLDYSVTAPDELTTIANLMHAPPAPFIPEERVGELVLLVIATWTGDRDEAGAAYAPLRALAEPVADTIGPMPYPVIYAFTEMAAAPHAAAVRSMFADALSDEAIDAALAAMAVATSPLSMVQYRGLGGAFARVPADATAFAHRARRYLVAVLGLWLDADEDPGPHRAWTEALWKRLQPEGDGVYVNFLDNEGEARVREAYPGGTYERLVAVKRRYDPENRFAANQNIRPSA